MLLFTFLMLISNTIVADPENMLRKINKYLELINTKRHCDFKPAENAKVCTNASASHKIPSSEDYKWESFDANSSYKFGETKYQWFAFQGDISPPENYDPKIHSLYFNFHVTRNFLVRPWDDDTPAGPEGRIWLNGKPYAAIDEFHHGASLNEVGHVEVRVFTSRCKAAPELASFGITLVHRKTESLYHRIRFLLSVIKELPEKSKERAQFIKILDGTVRKLDIRDLNYPIKLHPIRQHDKNASAFYKSVDGALEHLLSTMNELPKPTESDPAISVIGYSHIDTCWLWPYDITRFKSANTATSMLRLLDMPPSDFEGKEAKWRFLATTAQHYKWLKEDSPEVFERIKEAIKNGRWNADGASWVEPDTSLPSGESLVRQIVMGTRYFNKELGSKQTVMFLPDCFGFSANLPQILKKAGLDSFVTSKISWCEYTKFPYSTFVWRGIDGSDVLTHFITTPSAWSYQTATYTGVSTAYEMIGTLKQYKQRDLLPTSALHTSGNGDGGGGITEEMVWNLNLMADLPRIPEVPRLIFPTLEELFIPIREKQNELPIWDDELYLEYHRGTLTSQEEVKRQNRQLEAHLHNCEWLCVILSSVFHVNISKYQQELDDTWEDTMLFHFHDAIPGSSVNEANVDIIKRGRPRLTRLRELEKELTGLITPHIRTPTKENAQIVFNTLSHTRKIQGQVLKASGWSVKEDSAAIVEDDVETTTYERTLDENYVVHKLKEPFISGYLAPCASSKVLINEQEKKVTTPFFEILFAENGTIKSAKDIKTGREFFSHPGNQLELYEDRPINWPAWDIQLYHKEMQLPSPKFIGFVFKNDSVELKYEIERVGDGPAETTTINQTLTFSENEPIIDFKTVVNWTQHDKLLKVAFPTTIRSRSARFGIQFGHIQRPTHKNTKRDMARFEANGRWADLSESSSGVSLCSDVKAGFDVHEGIIRLSLLKAPMQTDQWADFGIRKFAYRLILHNGGFEESKVQALADEMVTPVILANYSQPTTPIDSSNSIPCDAQFVEVSDNGIVLETLKPAYDGVDGFIARFYEATGGWRSCNVKFPLLDASKWETKVVDLMEKEVENSRNLQLVEGPQLSVNLEFGAFELLTVLFTRKP
ncbi:glycosyl hydrolase [Tritrichomonas foetus]|uniref:alpha-mannosidase n=1 Tax=Tritrichomonas foetus TaxID=1144522 RepID=A0A1J4KPH2_9EUKA|nr:glycosyl hydrolase [Tritrichomonas foetus]|eukprot:OHT11606.1 glycosyl hydrolase [Tritrichomonas foetus]